MWHSSFVFNPCRFMFRDLDSLLTLYHIRTLYAEEKRGINPLFSEVSMKLEQACNDTIFGDVHAQSSRFFRQTRHGQDIPR